MLISDKLLLTALAISGLITGFTGLHRDFGNWGIAWAVLMIVVSINSLFRMWKGSSNEEA